MNRQSGNISFFDFTKAHRSVTAPKPQSPTRTYSPQEEALIKDNVTLNDAQNPSQCTQLPNGWQRCWRAWYARPSNSNLERIYPKIELSALQSSVLPQQLRASDTLGAPPSQLYTLDSSCTLFCLSALECIRKRKEVFSVDVVLSHNIY